MKTIFRNIIIMLALVFSFALFSCAEEIDPGEHEIDPGEPEYIFGTGDGFIYDGLFFFSSTNGFSYYDLSDTESGYYPVTSDAVASETEQVRLGGMNCVLDPWQTKKNGGQPVFVLVRTYFDKALDDNAERIISYNTKTNKVTVIKDKLDRNIQDLNIYGDTIIYGCNEGKQGYNFYRIDVNGENFKKMDNPKRRLYVMSLIHDGRMYYYDDATQMVYSNSLDFDDEQYLFTKWHGEVHIHDGYIYHSSKNEKYVEHNERGYYVTDLLRRPLSDLSKVETVLENTYIVRYCNDKIYFSLIDDTLDPELYSMPESRICEYSITTGEVREVFADKSGENVSYMRCDVSENHLILRICREAEGGGYSPTDYLAVNLATGEKTVLPRE